VYVFNTGKVFAQRDAWMLIVVLALWIYLKQDLGWEFVTRNSREAIGFVSAVILKEEGSMWIISSQEKLTLSYPWNTQTSSCYAIPAIWKMPNNIDRPRK
jgi:hypothetical protein